MNARLFIKRNSATILSFVAVAGVVATAITSANATPKAVRALDTAKLNKGEEELTKIEKVKIVLPVYLPTIITGAATVVCILGSNVLNQRTQASLSSAYAIVDQSYRDYRNSFALEAFKSNPMVAIQHDGDLSRIEDNTRLNSYNKSN